MHASKIYPATWSSAAEEVWLFTPHWRLESGAGTGSFNVMSTLTEIEKAAAKLPAEEQETLLRHLSQTLARRVATVAPCSVPAPDVPKEELQRIHALIEAEFSQVNAEDR